MLLETEGIFPHGWGGRNGGGGNARVLQGQKEGFRQQFLSVSNTGDQQGSGTLPKAADTELGLEARTFLNSFH